MIKYNQEVDAQIVTSSKDIARITNRSNSEVMTNISFMIFLIKKTNEWLDNSQNNSRKFFFDKIFNDDGELLEIKLGEVLIRAFSFSLDKQDQDALLSALGISIDGIFYDIAKYYTSDVRMNYMRFDDGGSN